MQITLDSLIRRSPHFDEKIWGGNVDTEKAAQQYICLVQFDF